MNYTTPIRFSTVGELESAISAVGTSGLREPAVFRFTGSSGLREAAMMYRILEAHASSSKRRWVIEDKSCNLLRQATHHYEQLDMLDLSLDLIELDLNDSIPMNIMRFDDVRITANAVATTADASNVFDLLDNVIIHSQRLARLCRGLGFGRDDMEVATLTQEDLLWLTEDGAGVRVLAGDGDREVQVGDNIEVLGDGGNDRRGLGLGRDDVEVPTLEDLLCLTEDGAGARVLASGNAGRKVEVGDSIELLGDGYCGGGNDGSADVVEVRVGVKVLAGSADVAETVARGDVAAGVDGKEVLLTNQPLLDQQHNLGVVRDVPGYLEGWIELKEDTVLALLKLKISKLRQAILKAKDRVVA